MQKKYLFIALYFGAILILIACAGLLYLISNTQKAPSIERNQTIQQDLCLGITCQPFAACNQGSCFCEQGFRSCEEACIPNDRCCTTTDCPTGTQCTNGSCYTIQEPETTEFNTTEPKVTTPSVLKQQLTCESNKEKNKNQDCVCRTGTKWCDRQNKCIPLSACCSQSNCNGDDYCKPYITSASFCIENKEGQKACKEVADGKPGFVQMGDYAFRVNITQSYFADAVDLSVNGKSYPKIGSGDTIPFDNLNVYVDSITVHGGKCIQVD